MSKRSSTRTAVVSKAMRKVDSETRKEVGDKRLRLLEADNYGDDVGDENDDGEYSDENDDVHTKRRRTKGKAGKGIRVMRKVRDLDRIIDSQIGALKQESDVVNYVSVNAEASTIPTRNFCSVCGDWGKYSCSRCGMRYCSIRCNNHHKETRCLKFSIM